jgi:hypothetical protein
MRHLRVGNSFQQPEPTASRPHRVWAVDVAPQPPEPGSPPPGAGQHRSEVAVGPSARVPFRHSGQLSPGYASPEGKKGDRGAPASLALQQQAAQASVARAWPDRGQLSLGALGLGLVLLVSVAWGTGVFYLLARLGYGSPVRLASLDGIHVYVGVLGASSSSPKSPGSACATASRECRASCPGSAGCHGRCSCSTRLFS